MITAANLHRSYSIGKKSIEILHGVNLHIAAGEKVFLCGPSGAGKTTLMYTLAGLETPQEGKVTINGTDIYSLSATGRSIFRNRNMGFIFQNYLLMPELTALENACLASSIGKRPRVEYVTELLDRVGLSHRLNHLPGELSGGEQQRVAIARALANDAPIIFADEPTGNLDRKNGAEVLDLLFGLADESRKTLVIVTHDEHLARRGDPHHHDHGRPRRLTPSTARGTLFFFRRQMQNGLVDAANHLGHAAVVQRFRKVSGLVVVRIAEEGRVRDHHGRHVFSPEVAVVGEVHAHALDLRQVEADGGKKGTHAFLNVAA